MTSAGSPGAAAATSRVVIEAREVRKTFGTIQALRGVSFALRAGEVHGLVGENGAGKSTLIKVLTGFYQPDGGSLLMDGKAVRFEDPRGAQNAGVSAVYQEINLIPERSVAENIYLGREPKHAGRLLIDRRRMLLDAGSVLQRYGLAIDPARKLRSLGLGLQQMVSIARVVSFGARVVVLDEPTSALSSAEVEVLFGVVERLRADGIALLFVSHRLSECYRLCDRLTVLRDGALVRSGTPQELPRPALVAAMLGREAASGAEPGAGRTGRAAAPGKAALSVRHLRWTTRVRDVGFDVHRREIVALAGLLGAGRTETLKAVFGAEQPEAGTVEIAGQLLGRLTPANAIRHGLGFLSEDRRAEGIFPGLSVQENLTASVLTRISRFGVVSRRRQRELVGRFIRELGIRTAGPLQPISGLSGGNQQKVLLARCLCASPQALMLDDPTRGIDVGAKEEVHRAIRELAAEGLGVLVTSSEIEELLALSHRLVVLDEGAVSGEMTTGAASADDVLALLATHPAARPE